MRLIDSTEQTLVAALQQGKPEALGLLYDKYAPVLLGLITRMVTDPEVSETVLQKTFAAIWLKRDEYKAIRLSFLSWIITIARDKAKVAMLSLKTKDFSFTAENSTFTQEVNANYEEPRERQLQEFCCRLEENEKKALQLVYLKGFSCDEAAAQLGIPVEELKSILKTAVKHLGAEKAA